MLTNPRDAFGGSQGHQIWYILYVRYGFLLVCYSKSVSKTHCFWDNRLQKCRDLENRVRCPSWSLEMSPFDGARMISYWRSIVTMSILLGYSMLKNIATLKSRSRVNQG